MLHPETGQEKNFQMSPSDSPRERGPANVASSSESSAVKKPLSICRLQVCVGDMKHGFDDHDHFLQWLQGEEGASTVVCLRGLLAQGGKGGESGIH